MVDCVSYIGEWFLPNNVKNKISGTLTFDIDNGIDLDLAGTFDDFGSEFSQYDFILGYTSNGKIITLYKVYQYNRSMSNGYLESKYTALYILQGYHFFNNSEFKFQKINARFDVLDEWVRVSGFEKVESDFDTKTVEILYTLPKSIPFTINNDLDGELEFDCSMPIGEMRKEACIKQKVSVTLKSREKKPFLDVLGLLMRFQNFLTLASFESAYPVSISLPIIDNRHHYKKGIAKNVKVIYKPGFNRRPDNKKWHREYLFLYDDVKVNFNNIISKWYSLGDDIKPVVSLLLESFYHKKINENRFLDIAHAIEVFHRRLRKNIVRDKLEHKGVIKEILESVNPKHKDWLREKLGFSNEPSLQQRLEAVIKDVSSDFLDKLIDDKNKFIKDVKHSRNYYTHYDKSLEKKALKGSSLHTISEKMRILLIIIILLEMGFEKDKVNHLLENSSNYLFNHLV